MRLSEQRELIRRRGWVAGRWFFLGAAERPVTIELLGHFAPEGLTSIEGKGVSLELTIYS
jgi:hypothetical protein